MTLKKPFKRSSGPEMTKDSHYVVAFYLGTALNEHGRPIATIKITIISRNDHVCGPRVVFFFETSGRHGAARSGDSASIKSYDNRARLIPLPIINARIKLDPSDESAERRLAIAPITRIMI